MIKFFRENKSLKIFQSYPLLNLTTFKIGGKADYFCQPDSIEKLIDAFGFANKNNLNIYILGGGANVLISDDGVKGLVVSTKKLNKCQVKNENVIVQSGLSVEKLNNKIKKIFLSGLEFSSGLPGSVGGAVYMNARAYGGQFSDVVESVCAIDMAGNKIEFLKNELDFSYKKSIFMKRNDLFIYSIKFKLKKSDKKTVKDLYNKNNLDRIQKGQFLYPSAGCIFKNDYDNNLIIGKLIDDLGLKGIKIGNARIFEKHGNFIINTGNARAEDVKKLIEQIENKVYEKNKIKLQREVILLGF